jgi:hypothetical protein
MKSLLLSAKMCEINENAYMNGYGWAAFLNYYLSKHAPDVLEGMDADPEAGMYAADYDLSAENEEKANEQPQGKPCGIFNIQALF